MLEANQLPHLRDAIASNRCVLFVGAGFSSGAKNRLGLPLPLSRDLARMIWNWAGLDAPYDDSPLSITYQAAIQSRKPLAPLRDLLESNLLVTDVPTFYDVLPRVYWLRVYGTNVDNLLEEVYRRAPTAPALETLAAPADEFRERDQFLRRIQYVKLHGSLPGDPSALTFGTLDFAGRANSQDDWWRHFVRDYVFNTTVFIGSELDEPLFWQAIESRGKQGPNPEQRAESYLVSPWLSAARRSLLKAFNITHVQATAEQFLEWLTATIPLPDRLSVLAAALPEAAEVLRHYGASVATQEAVPEFLATFARVPAVVPTGSASARAFLRGAPPTWTDIAIEADALLDVGHALLARVKEALERPPVPAVVALLGEGGTGKSTILKRVSFSLVHAGHQIFFADGADRPDIDAVYTTLRAFNRKVCLAIDNAALFGPVLAELVGRLKKLPFPPVVVIASRYIPFEQRIRALLAGEQWEDLEIPPLSDPDIDAILGTLERHNQLGHLAPLSHDERRYEFKQRARKQLLVALREATEGEGFNVIMQSEFAELENRETRILFLCGALATATLVDLTLPQLFDCSELPPSDVLRILRRDLRGMLHETDRAGVVPARHPIIADYILDNVAGKEEVMEAYRRVLLAVARDIYPGVGRRHRAWRLFVRLISHQNVYDRFGEDIDHARGVYELTAHAFANDGHFWLQYANLEVDYGRASFARPLLANAEGLLGSTDLVLNTRAHMMLREALTVSSAEEAKRLRADAEDILRKQMEFARDDDEYPFHVYLTHILGWIRAWSPDRESKKQDLEELMSLSESVRQRMPRNAKLRGVHDAITREYLALAVTP
jgi:hypothetical protein